MSAATDKARFFLEKSVPELKEYERKGIFTKASRECAGTQNNS
jgi:U3 small nucleolar RNA-associated protein 6